MSKVEYHSSKIVLEEVGKETESTINPTEGIEIARSPLQNYTSTRQQPPKPTTPSIPIQIQAITIRLPRRRCHPPSDAAPKHRLHLRARPVDLVTLEDSSTLGEAHVKETLVKLGDLVGEEGEGGRRGVLGEDEGCLGERGGGGRRVGEKVKTFSLGGLPGFALGVIHAGGGSYSRRRQVGSPISPRAQGREERIRKEPETNRATIRGGLSCWTKAEA
jgi:hypothetical protein